MKKYLARFASLKNNARQGNQGPLLFGNQENNLLNQRKIAVRCLLDIKGPGHFRTNTDRRVQRSFSLFSCLPPNNRQETKGNFPITRGHPSSFGINVRLLGKPYNLACSHNSASIQIRWARGLHQCMPWPNRSKQKPLADSSRHGLMCQFL